MIALAVALAALAALLATFTDTVTLGSVIVGVMVGLSILVSIVYGARWKTAAEVEAANAAAWEDTARRLEMELGMLRKQFDVLRGRVAELEGLPDVAAVHAEIRLHDEKSAVAMREHDRNAEARSDRIVAAIDAVKDVLTTS